MWLGPSSRCSLAHRRCSNQKLLNPTVLISPYQKQEIQFMKSKSLIVVFLSGVYLAGNANTLKRIYLQPPPPVSPWDPVFVQKTK